MRSLQASELVPSGFIVENLAIDAECVVVAITASAASCPCPLCGAAARRVHSRYLRRLVDLPVGGRRTELVLRARGFSATQAAVSAGVFAERFEGAVGRHARRTSSSRRRRPLPCDRARRPAGGDIVATAQCPSEQRHAASHRATSRRGRVSRRRRSSASTIGLGNGTIAMARFSATSSVEGRLRCCLTGSRRRAGLAGAPTANLRSRPRSRRRLRGGGTKSPSARRSGR